MDLSNLRALIAQAREDDEKATPGPWKVLDGMLVGPKKELVADVSLARYALTASELRLRAGTWCFLAHARSRESLLARALEAALEVVEAAEHMTNEHACYSYDDGTIPPLEATLSRFRAVALEGEGEAHREGGAGHCTRCGADMRDRDLDPVCRPDS